MREAIAELREALPGVRLVLAAMGPKMCALAGARVRRRLLQLDDARLRRLGAARGRGAAPPARAATPRPCFGYVRTAVGDDAGRRLAKEEAFYRDLHDGYRHHFERLGEPEGTVGVAAARRVRRPRARSPPTGPSTWSSSAGLASATVEAMGTVAEAAAPRE